MPKTLTRVDIVESIRSEFDLPKIRCAEMVEILLDMMKTALASDEDVMISGFGKFNVKDKKERRGRKPATGEGLVLPARRVVKFRCSAKLRDKVNGN